MSRPKQPRPLASSTRSRPRLSSLADLITHSEHTIASSQATVFSEQSQRTAFTQSYEGFNDLQNYEDIIAEDGDSLRITPEEEKRIQSILELARKGKINAGNAFEVPVRVVDPQLGEGQNMRFWKFASELLSASMGIYDKRVEHVYLGTNRMFDSLIRIGSNKQDEEQPEERNRRQRGIILKIDLSQIGGTEALASYDFGGINCQEPSKLDVKKSVLQFKTDPMINKRLQAFDSDSMKSLFLNAFQIGSQLEVTFFHNCKQPQQEQNEKNDGKSSYQQSTEYSDEQSTKVPCQNLQYPSFIDEEYKKLNLISRTGSLFSEMSQFRKQNHRQGLFEEMNLIGDIREELSLSLQAESTNNAKNLALADENSYSLSIQKDYTQFTHYSEELPIPTLEDGQNTNSVSERFGPPFFLSARNSQSSVDEMTPWELQFKGLKLQRRKNKRGERRNRRQPLPSREVVDNSIDFLDKVKISRNAVFKIKNQRKFQVNQSKMHDKFVLPLNVDPFKRTFQYVPNKKTQQSTFLCQENNIDNHNSQNMPDNAWAQTKSEGLEDWRLLQMGQPLQALHWGPSEVSKNEAPMMLRHIRQVKERLYQRVVQGPIRLSYIDIGFSPSSMLVVALHLANEMRIELAPGQFQGDILLQALR